MLSFSWNAPPKFPYVRRERTCVVLQFEDLGHGRVKVKMILFGWGVVPEWDHV